MKRFINFSEEKDTHKTKDGKIAKKGLWYNIHQKRKRGEKPAKPGEKDYPKTLNIDELNKSTLASYVKKASDDRAKNAYDVGKSGKMNTKGLKRRQGINRAVNKLTKEESVNEFVRKTADLKPEKYVGSDGKVHVRMVPTKVGKDKDRVTNEVLDTSQALDNYRKKAKTQSDKARNAATAKIVRGNPDIDKEKNIIRKREKGLDMVDKTANKQFRKSLGLGYSSKKESTFGAVSMQMKHNRDRDEQDRADRNHRFNSNKGTITPNQAAKPKPKVKWVLTRKKSELKKENFEVQKTYTEALGARSFQSPGNMIRDLGSRSSSSSDNHDSEKKTDSKSSTPSKPLSKLDWSKRQARRSKEAKANAKEHDQHHAYHMQQHDKHMAKTTGLKGKIFGSKARKAAEAHKAAADAHKKASAENLKMSKHWADLSAASAHEHKTGDKSRGEKLRDAFKKKGHTIHDGNNSSDTAHSLSHAAQKVSESVNLQGAYISEKLSVGNGMGAWIDDFKKSDAPQFKGKNEKERRDMAIAAYLSAKRGGKNEAFDFRVNVDGFPEMFMSGNSPGEVKANLRALVKQPSMIKSVDRVTKHDKKKEFRKKAMANEGTMGDKPEWGTPEATKVAKKKTPGEQDEGFMDTVKKGFSYVMKNNNGKASTDTNRKSTSGSQNSKPSPSGGSIASKINFGGKYSK